MLRDFVIGIGIALLATAVFAPACANDFFALDDPLYVTDNPHVCAGLSRSGAWWAFTATRAANWHPLTWLSLQCDATLFGVRPWGFHLTNVLLHAANAALVFWVLKDYTSRVWPSAVTALLFALHPLRVESVAWISERKDVLSDLFGLLALLAYRRYTSAPGPGRFAVIVLALVLSLLSKPTWVTLPCMLLLLDFWPLERLHLPINLPELSALLLEKLPLFGVAIASCLVTYYVQQTGGAVGALQHYPFLERVANAAVAYMAYVAMTLWPINLAPFYPYAKTGPAWWQALAATAAILALTFVCFRQAARRPYLVVGWLWYLGTLVPMIGLVQVGTQALADRYSYVPTIGLATATVWFLADSRWPRSPWALRSATAIVLVALTFLTEKQLLRWRDSEIIWHYTLGVTEANWMAHASLGSYLLGQERRMEAQAHFEAAARIQPEYPHALFGLGMCLRDEDPERAKLLLTKCLIHDPGNALVFQGLGEICHKQGIQAEAEKNFRTALRINPKDVISLVGLGAVLEERGQAGQAMRCYQSALDLEPSSGGAHVNLGALLDRQGRTEEAAAHYRAALRFEPFNAEIHVNVGWLLDNQGQRTDALAALHRAVELAPGLARAHFNLGTVYGKHGDHESAIKHLSEALRINPGYSQAQFNLAKALSAAGQVEPSLQAFRRAVELAPTVVLFRQGLAAALRNAGRNEEALIQEREIQRLAPASGSQ